MILANRDIPGAHDPEIGPLYDKLLELWPIRKDSDKLTNTPGNFTDPTTTNAVHILHRMGHLLDDAPSDAVLMKLADPGLRNELFDLLTRNPVPGSPEQL